MAVILDNDVGIPCPGCGAPLVSIGETQIYKCPQCNIEFTDYKLREYWDFLLFIF